MAQALEPGTARRVEEASAAADAVKRVLVIKLAWSDETHRIAVNNVPVDHRLAVRKATGLPLTAFIGGESAIDVDSIAVLVWVSRRLHGSPSLSWKQFERTWPDTIDEGDIEVWAEDAVGHRIDEDGNAVPDPYDPAAESAEPDDPES
jgi:hypothetical protein